VNHLVDNFCCTCCSFSRYGAQQLHFDFIHFVSWFEHEELGLSLDMMTDINSLPTIIHMKNAILLLACQPDSSKNRRDEVGLLGNQHGGSSSSTISQVSLGLFSIFFNFLNFREIFEIYSFVKI